MPFIKKNTDDYPNVKYISYLNELLEMNEMRLQLQLNYINLKDCSSQRSSWLLNSCCDSSMLLVVEQIMQKLRDFVNMLLHEFVRKIRSASDTGKTWMQGRRIVQ